MLSDDDAFRRDMLIDWFHAHAPCLLHDRDLVESLVCLFQAEAHAAADIATYEERTRFFRSLSRQYEVTT